MNREIKWIHFKIAKYTIRLQLNDLTWFGIEYRLSNGDLVDIMIGLFFIRKQIIPF